MAGGSTIIAVVTSICLGGRSRFFGIPYQDIGSLQMIYITLTGDYSVERESPGFAAFVEWQAQAEIASVRGALASEQKTKRGCDLLQLCRF